MSKLMRIRAGVIMLLDGKIALIKRVKAKRTYYVVPGGGVDEGEYTHQAARREAKEELGLDVILERLVAVVERVEQGAITHIQLYYLVKAAEGTFGAGKGEEYGRSESHGTYEPVWVSLGEAGRHRVYPSTLVEYLARHSVPEGILHLCELSDYPT